MLHQQALKEDLTASAIMINNAKQHLLAEELLRQQTKEKERQYQEKIMQENMEDMKRKQLQKLRNNDEDKRILMEQERQHQQEEMRRAKEFQDRIRRSSEGPAHKVYEVCCWSFALSSLCSLDDSVPTMLL